MESEITMRCDRRMGEEEEEEDEGEGVLLLSTEAYKALMSNLDAISSKLANNSTATTTTTHRHHHRRRRSERDLCPELHDVVCRANLLCDSLLPIVTNQSKLREFSNVSDASVLTDTLSLLCTLGPAISSDPILAHSLVSLV